MKIHSIAYIFKRESAILHCRLWTYYACYWNDFVPDFDSSNKSETSPLVSKSSPTSRSPQPLIDEADSKSLGDRKSSTHDDLSGRSSDAELANINESPRASQKTQKDATDAKPKAGRDELTTVKLLATEKEPATKPKK